MTEERFRIAHYLDWEFIRCLRNSERQGFVQQHSIELQEHFEYMIKNWRNYYIYYAITHYGVVNYGFIGVVDNDIRFCILPQFQGKGLGTKMLNWTKEKYPDAIGKVKHDNPASSKAFTKAGYQIFHSDEQFSYYTCKNIGHLEGSELRKMVDEIAK